MAVDTQAKRISIMHILVPSYPASGDPDGTVDRSDRQSFMWIYRIGAGIAAVTLDSVSVTQPTITASVTQPTAAIQVRNILG